MTSLKLLVRGLNESLGRRRAVTRGRRLDLKGSKEEVRVCVCSGGGPPGMSKAFSPRMRCGANQFLEQIGRDGEEAVWCLSHLPSYCCGKSTKIKATKKRIVH